MVRHEDGAERAVQLQGKLQKIKEHTDWLLTLEKPGFSQQALYNAVKRGGWVVDRGNEKNNMKRYLVSIEENAEESEERREKARKLRDKLDTDTQVNKKKRMWLKMMMKREGKLMIGNLGGYKNKFHRIIGFGGPKSNQKRKAALGGRRAGADAEGQGHTPAEKDEPVADGHHAAAAAFGESRTQTGRSKENHGTEDLLEAESVGQWEGPAGADARGDGCNSDFLQFQAGSGDLNQTCAPSDYSQDDHHRMGDPAEAYPVATRDRAAGAGTLACCSDGADGAILKFEADIRASSGSPSNSRPGLNINPATPLPTQTVPTCPPSSSHQTTPAHSRQILGDLTPNAHFGSSPAAAPTKPQTPSIKYGPKQSTGNQRATPENRDGSRGWSSNQTHGFADERPWWGERNGSQNGGAAFYGAVHTSMPWGMAPGIPAAYVSGYEHWWGAPLGQETWVTGQTPGMMGYPTGLEPRPFFGDRCDWAGCARGEWAGDFFPGGGAGNNCQGDVRSRHVCEPIGPLPYYGQPENESGGGFGGSRKRGRDDVEDDVVPRARRAMYTPPAAEYPPVYHQVRYPFEAPPFLNGPPSYFGRPVAWLGDHVAPGTGVQDASNNAPTGIARAPTDVFGGADLVQQPEDAEGSRSSNAELEGGKIRPEESEARLGEPAGTEGPEGCAAEGWCGDEHVA